MVAWDGHGPSTPGGNAIVARLFDTSGGSSGVHIAAVAPSKAEDATVAFAFDVTLDVAPSATQSVRWHVEGSGADAADAADFEGGALPSGTLVFAAGETRKTVTVRVAGDAVSEADEGFAVRLSDPSAGLFIATASAGATIADDDDPPPSVVRGTPGDDALAHAPGTDVYDGLGGRDALDMGRVGRRGVEVGVRADDDGVALARGGETCLLRGVEEVRFADGRLVFDADDPAAQVVRLYEAALDRLPDQGGLNASIGAVGGGRSLADLARGFLGSDEFGARFGGDAAAGDLSFVDRLYGNVLGRAGEAEGRGFWVAALEGGAGRAEVLVAFSESAENKAGTAALVRNGIWDRSEAAAEVARLYDTAFGRRPDAEGLAFWKDALEGGAATLAQVAEAFAGGAEFRGGHGALADRRFVEALYGNALDRAPGEAEAGHWVDRLDAGAARSAVVLAFSESAEHVALTAARTGGEAPAEFGVLFA